MVDISQDTFFFGNVNMGESYGIRMLFYDFLIPSLRSRKVVIPNKSGAYDYGAKYYDERILHLECECVRPFERGEIRELAYTLSQKNRITLTEEPGKYYIGRLYDPTEIRPLGEAEAGYGFELNFICDPFAYGIVKEQKFKAGILQPTYSGTARAPTRLTIKNTSTEALVAVQIRVRERREVY